MNQVLFSVLIGTGLFLVFADLFRVPSVKASKAITGLSKRQRRKTKAMQVWLQSLTLWLSRYIRINEYKRMQIAGDLQTANINISPELHIANAIVKAGFCGLLAIPAFFIFPLIVPLVIAIAVTLYFKESKGIQERIKAKRDAINYELPRLVFTIDKTLMHNRDVLSMLESYRQNAGPELKHELSVTVADMRSGNYESALTRLESRVGSSMLSDVVRGLIGILRGDETELYWATLSVKFADVQRQILKQQALKVPGKVKRLSMVLLMCFVATYIVVIGMEILTSLTSMFA